MRNNIPLAILGGTVAAIAGAAIWALITVVTNFQIGFMAVGVGILVGFAVRALGKGETRIFSVIGAVLALLGCLLGNLLTGIAYLAGEWEVGYVDALRSFDYGGSYELLAATFSPIDLLFYAIAVWEGFKLATVPGIDPAA